MGVQNKCIWVGPKNDLSYKDITTPYEPGDDQALISVEYSGVNPADLKHSLHFGWHNRVAGYEYCGTVQKTGKGFPYAIGDVVYGSIRMGLGSAFGAHQDLMLIEGNSLVAKLPSTLPPAAASTLSLALRTAADAMFNLMEIPFPAIGSPGQKRSSGILIWGGGSAVGFMGIQLAKAAGLHPIITTASTKNHETLKKLGATHCFDYRDGKAAAGIQAVLDSNGWQPLHYVFDAVVTDGEDSSTKQCESLKTASDAYFICVLPLPKNPKWTWCVASRGWDIPFPPPLGPIPARQEWESRLEKTVSWAADNYGSEVQIPRLRVVEDEKAALEAIELSAYGKISFEKIAVKHPL